MAEEKGKTVRAFKGFDKDLKCRDFQYEIGKEYEIEGDVKCCGNGFHACENPFDVFGFYPIIDNAGNFNRFCEVEGSGKADKDNEKTAFSKLKVKSEIGIKEFISAFIEIVKESVKTEKDDSDSAQIGSSGDSAQIGSSGYSAKIISEGKYSVICCAGNNSRAKAKKGSWITLSEWKHDGTEFIPVCVKTEFVDGDRIKENTFYILKDGEFKEVINE